MDLGVAYISEPSLVHAKFPSPFRFRRFKFVNSIFGSVISTSTQNGEASPAPRYK